MSPGAKGYFLMIFFDVAVIYLYRVNPNKVNLYIASLGLL